MPDAESNEYVTRQRAAWREQEQEAQTLALASDVPFEDWLPLFEDIAIDRHERNVMLLRMELESEYGELALVSREDVAEAFAMKEAA